MLFYSIIECNTRGFTIHSFYYVGSHKFTVFVIQQLAVYKTFFVDLNKMYSIGVKYLKSRIKLLLGAVCKNWSPGTSYM